MTELPVPRSEIIERLKKIEGQVRGLQKMVGDERDCVEILTQLSAVKAALQSVAGKVLQNYTSICLLKHKGKDIGAELAYAISIWVGGKGG